VANHDKMSDLARAGMPKGEHRVFPVFRKDPHLPKDVAFDKNPSMKNFARRQFHEKPQSCNVHVRGWGLQLVTEIGDNVDPVISGTVATSDFESLRKDPIVATQCDRDLGFQPEWAKAGTLITIFDGCIADGLGIV
jgi:hypothetical protein